MERGTRGDGNRCRVYCNQTNKFPPSRDPQHRDQESHQERRDQGSKIKRDCFMRSLHGWAMKQEVGNQTDRQEHGAMPKP